MLPVQPTGKGSSNTKATRTDWNFLKGRAEVTAMQQKEKNQDLIARNLQTSKGVKLWQWC